MKPLTKYKFGWLPDVPDGRDYLYLAIKPKLKVPADVDLSGLCSAVEDQGEIGSCTAQALAGNIEFLDNKPDGVYEDVSRLFIYYNERALRGMEMTDSGAMLRDGIKTLNKHGVCSEKLWPYRIRDFTKKPPPACYADAGSHRIVSYYRLQSLDEMFTCLADGYPFVFGFTVYESFMSEETSKTGRVRMPGKEERELGGHAVMAVGFDRKTRRFLVRNSWGEGWGMKGYCVMPFKYLEELSDDFWTIRR